MNNNQVKYKQLNVLKFLYTEIPTDSIWWSALWTLPYVCEMNVIIVCLLSRNLGHSWKALVKFKTESVSLWFLDFKVYTVPETQCHIPVESARQSQQERTFSWRAAATNGGLTQWPAGSNLQTWTRPKRQQMCTKEYGRCYFGRDFILRLKSCVSLWEEWGLDIEYWG